MIASAQSKNYLGKFISARIMMCKSNGNTFGD